MLFDIGETKPRPKVEDRIGEPSTHDGREWVRTHRWDELMDHEGQEVLIAFHDGWRQGELVSVVDDETGPDSSATIKLEGGEIEIYKLAAVRVERGSNPAEVCPLCEGRKSRTARMCKEAHQERLRQP